MLSIIVPVYNESESLERLHAELHQTCDRHGMDYELLLIDDGSTDGSWPTIERLSKTDSRMTGIRLRRNFGKAAALSAGMRHARGDRVLMMDADLQDDPAEIPNLMAKMDEGYDVINGWKQRRLDPWHKVYPSKVFNLMVSVVTGLKLHDHNCGLKLFRRQVTSEIRIYGELHRFIPVLADARGFRVTELAVNHRPRQFGRSKYGLRRFVRGFLDLLTVKFLTGFGQRPQHMMGAAGIVLFMLGILGLVYLGVFWIVKTIDGQDPAIGTRPLLAYSIALTLLGAQATSLGLLAELFVAYVGRESDTYSIAEFAGARAGEPDPDGNGE